MAAAQSDPPYNTGDSTNVPGFTNDRIIYPVSTAGQAASGVSVHGVVIKMLPGFVNLTPTIWSYRRGAYIRMWFAWRYVLVVSVRNTRYAKQSNIIFLWFVVEIVID